VDGNSIGASCSAIRAISRAFFSFGDHPARILTVRGIFVAFRVACRMSRTFSGPSSDAAPAPTPDHPAYGAAHVDVHGVGKPPSSITRAAAASTSDRSEDLGNQGPVAGIAAKIAERLPCAPGQDRRH